MSNRYPFELKPLPYEYNALEPHIDEATMKLHHDKHLKAYVDKLNEIVGPYPEFHNWYLETFLCNIHSLPNTLQTPIRNNAGGVYNHNLFFSLLSSKDTNSIPIGNLAEKIEKDFGSYENFKEKFKEAALSRFGSGYAWLVIDRNKNLKIITTANQNTPLELNLYPVLVIDVWEHAYYLKYNNRRNEYIDNFFSVLNFKKAEELYNRFFA